MFENKLGNTVSQIKDDVINLINLKLAYYELILTKRIIKCVSALIGNIIIAIFFILVLVSLSFAFVSWYGSKYGNIYDGFLILSGIYVIIGFATYCLTKKFIVRQITRLLNDREDNKDNCLSTLKVPQNLTELDQQIDYLNLKIKKTNVDIQYDFNEMSEMMSLRRIILDIMSNTLVFRKIADFIKRFTNNGDDEETNDEDKKTDETIDNEGTGNDPVDEK